MTEFKSSDKCECGHTYWNHLKYKYKGMPRGGGLGLDKCEKCGCEEFKLAGDDLIIK